MNSNERSEEIVAVLRQALEALQRCEGRSKADEGDRHRAITSLRQAIADVEKQSDSVEPVGFYDADNKDLRQEIPMGEDGDWWQPVYTHPYTGQPKRYVACPCGTATPREPLTNEQKDSIIKANKMYRDSDEIDVYGVIDDIEAAHGITKEQP